jgi:hypothetical protein
MDFLLHPYWLQGGFKSDNETSPAVTIRATERAFGRSEEIAENRQCSVRRNYIMHYDH